MPPSACVACASIGMGPQQVCIELVPGLPPVIVDTEPGMTAEEAEQRAAVQAGLADMNPRRLGLKEIFPSWAFPGSWNTREEPQARTGCNVEVRSAELDFSFDSVPCVCSLRRAHPAHGTWSGQL